MVPSICDILRNILRSGFRLLFLAVLYSKDYNRTTFTHTFLKTLLKFFRNKLSRKCSALYHKYRVSGHDQPVGCPATVKFERNAIKFVPNPACKLGDSPLRARNCIPVFGTTEASPRRCAATAAVFVGYRWRLSQPSSASPPR